MALINCPECNREISNKAKSCPNCGIPIENTIDVDSGAQVKNKVGISDQQDKHVCPSCHSNNTQSIKMMCLNGTSSGSSTGIGVTSDLDLGVGGMRSNSQTALASQFMPGNEPGSTMVGCGCLNVILGIICLGVGIFGGEPIILLVGLFCALMGWWGVATHGGYPEKHPKRKKWKEKNEMYEKGWICHKCGKVWIP